MRSRQFPSARAFWSVIIAAVIWAQAGPAAVYTVSPSGSDSAAGTETAPWRTIQNAADRLQPGDTVRIRSGTYHEAVTVTRSGSPGAEIRFMAYPGEAPVLDGTGVTLGEGLSGLFSILGASYIRVSGLRTEHVGPGLEQAGFLLQDSNHVVLERNTTYDTVSSGIGVWGCREIVLDGNEIIQAGNGGMQECISVAGTAGFEVVNNRVHDGGAHPIGGEGICLKDGSHGGRVRHNEVYRLHSRLGIYVDAWDKHTYDIEVDGNICHDIEGADGFALASEMGGLLENIRVTNNVAYGNGLRGLTVVDYGGVSTHPMRNLLIANNTFAGNGASWGGGIAVDNAQATGVAVRNNILSGNRSFQLIISEAAPQSAVTADHNLIDGFRGEPGETRGSDFVEGNPLFVDPAAFDFHLREGSPAIDRGSSAGAPATDFDGVIRPQQAGVDIGAFERPAPGSGCQTSATALCLNGSRFRVTARYRDYGGNEGDAQAVPLTNETGYFWFFSRDNVEVVVKVLDFCGVNQRWAVYASGLTDVAIVLTLTDTRAGSTKSYTNALGVPFVLVRDAPFACP